VAKLSTMSDGWYEARAAPAHVWSGLAVGCRLPKFQEHSLRWGLAETWEPRGMEPASKACQHDQTHPPSCGLSRDIRARIGEKLQLMYGRTIYEGVPRHFDGLIRRIDSQKVAEARKISESKRAKTFSRTYVHILGPLLLRVRKSHSRE